MVRKPKTQPSPDDAAAVPASQRAAPDEAAVPARRGRKPKAAALSFASPAAADVGSPAPDDARADALKTAPTKAPGRKGPGRKPKQRAGAEAATLPQATAIEQVSAEADPSVAGSEQASAEGDALVAEVAFPPDAVVAGDAARGDTYVDDAAPGAAPSTTGPEATARAAPAARWDRATDRVQFDWPEIKRMAAHDGPNQAMAKLLVAARAEGAGSRWPF